MGVLVDVRGVYHPREPEPGRCGRIHGDVVAGIEGADRVADHELRAVQFGIGDARETNFFNVSSLQARLRGDSYAVCGHSLWPVHRLPASAAVNSGPHFRL